MALTWESVRPRNCCTWDNGCGNVIVWDHAEGASNGQSTRTVKSRFMTQYRLNDEANLSTTTNLRERAGANAPIGFYAQRAATRNLSISAAVSLTTCCKFRSSDCTTSLTLLLLTGSSRSTTPSQTLRLVSCPPIPPASRLLSEWTRYPLRRTRLQWFCRNRQSRLFDRRLLIVARSLNALVVPRELGSGGHMLHIHIC